MENSTVTTVVPAIRMIVATVFVKERNEVHFTAEPIVAVMTAVPADLGADDVVEEDIYYLANIMGQGVSWWPHSYCNELYEDGLRSIEICPWPASEDEARLKDDLLTAFKERHEQEEQQRRLEAMVHEGPKKPGIKDRGWCSIMDC